MSDIIFQFTDRNDLNELFRLLMTIEKEYIKEDPLLKSEYLINDLYIGEKCNYYNHFKLPKKNGGYREIFSPIPELKRIQECISIILEQHFLISKYACGFIKGKSIKDNASFHVSKIAVLNIDVKDFFSSITKEKFLSKIFQTYGIDRNQLYIKIIERFCFLKNDSGKYVLPQGAPTSPILSNIYCYKLDWRLHLLSEKYRLSYSRYADDITFSSISQFDFNRFDFKVELIKELREFGFKLNHKKTRIKNQNQRQEVTGIIVNKKLNLKKRFIKRIRMYLYYCEEYGLDKATSIYAKNTNKKCDVKIFLSFLRGNISYVKMIRGWDDNLYVGLNGRFEKLREKYKAESKLSDVLKVNYDFHSRGITSNTLYYPYVLYPENNCIVRSYSLGEKAIRGITEVGFENQLREHFSDRFLVLGNVLLATSNKSRPYEPDIALVEISNKNTIRIDIEIDEPYSSKNGTPCHFLNENSDRDMWFVERGWIVIRFSERQIHQDPVNCILYIEDIISIIEDSGRDFSRFLRLLPEKRWTYEDAIQLANVKYRECYLGVDFIKNSFEITKNEKVLNLSNLENIQEKYVQRKVLSIKTDSDILLEVFQSIKIVNEIKLIEKVIDENFLSKMSKQEVNQWLIYNRIQNQLGVISVFVASYGLNDPFYEYYLRYYDNSFTRCERLTNPQKYIYNNVLPYQMSIRNRLLFITNSLNTLQISEEKSQYIIGLIEKVK